MKRIFFISCILFCIHLQPFSQCEISNLSYIPYGCEDGQTFDLDITFDFESIGSAFSVSDGQTDYGNYPYNALPITIFGLNSDCLHDYEFTIMDVDSLHCSHSFILEESCCPTECALNIEYIVSIDCSHDDNVLSLIDLDHSQAFSTHYTLYQDGFNLGIYPYSDLPDTIALAETAVSTIVVCDYTNENCCDTLMTQLDCVCAIYDLEYSFVSCNDIDSSFMLALDFEHFMVTDSFDVGGNGIGYGTFAYADLPVKIGPLFLDSLDYEIAVFDQLNPFCFNFIELGVIEECILSCTINHLIAESTACDTAGNFYIEFSFNANNPSDAFFEVLLNGAVIDTMSYGLDHYKIGPYPGDCTTEYNLMIIDLSNGDCFSNLALVGTVCCEEDPKCAIEHLTAEIQECEEDSIFYVDIQFDFSEGVSDHFILSINDAVYDTLAYGETFYNIGPLAGDCETIYTFTVQDLDSIHCVDFYELDEPVCCEPVADCHISNFLVHALECDSMNQFYIDFSFDYAETLSDTFYLKDDNNTIGIYSYSDSTFIAGPFEGDCVTAYRFILQDQLDESCVSNFALLDEVCCEVMDTCSISEIEILSLECLADNYILSYNFSHEHTEGEGYDIFINDQFSSFRSYSDLPETILLDNIEDGDTTVFIEICDHVLTDCCSHITVDLDLCNSDCIIDSLNIELLECQDSVFYISVDIFGEGTSDVFQVEGNGHDYGSYNYDDLPIELGPFLGLDSLIYELIITDSEDSQCAFNTSFHAPNCEVLSQEDINFDDLLIYSQNQLFLYQAMDDIGLYSIEGKQVKQLDKRIGFQDLDLNQTGIYIIIAQKAGTIYSKIIFIE